MDILKLPVPFLSSLSDYLSTLDLVNLLTAVYNTTKQPQLQNSYLFKLIFDPKRCDLESCFKLDYDQFKKILKFYKTKEFFIERININFCQNLTRHLTLKRIINETMSKISSLIELDFFNTISPNNHLDLCDLSNLLHSCPNLKRLSFNLRPNLDTTDSKMVNMNQLEYLRVEFKSSSTQTLFKHLFDSCSNLTHLELYSTSHGFSLNLTSQNFPHHKLSKLSHLVTGTNNITINLNDYLFELIKKLNSFSLNVCIDKSDNNLSSLINEKKIAKCDLNFGIDLNYLRSNNIVLNTNPYVMDDIVQDYFGLDFADKLNSIRLYILIWPCILSTINLNLDRTKFLKKIDFASIHVHCKDSICKLVSSLTELSELGLPCCALSIELGKEEKKTSFKRIFEESDEEDSGKDKTSSNRNKELSHLNKMRVVKLTICTPDQVNFKDKYFFNCYNVDVAELAEIPKWKFIKSLSFSSFKLAGGLNRFDSFLNELSSKTSLKELNLYNFNSFLTYDFQVVFSKHLKKFIHLKKLVLSHSNFSFSAKFCESLVHLAPTLTILKLEIENIDCRVLGDHLNAFKKFHNLILFEIICKNKESDIKFIKKSFKNVLKDWTFYQIYNVNSYNLISQQQEVKPNVFLRVSTENVKCLNPSNFYLNRKDF